ncbi:MAG: FAD binding domain-containing protein, partial [Syntrophorhabdaceae bacterium]|nr:FAD binding domain-containing protein [Syntrophorhabdaceae bacterium]
MRLPHFQYHAPKTIEALASFKERYGNQALIMGGGTELLPRMKLRLINPEHIISVLNIKELGKIKINKEKEIEIGA